MPAPPAEPVPGQPEATTVPASTSEAIVASPQSETVLDMATPSSVSSPTSDSPGPIYDSPKDSRIDMGEEDEEKLIMQTPKRINSDDADVTSVTTASTAAPRHTSSRPSLSLSPILTKNISPSSPLNPASSASLTSTLATRYISTRPNLSVFPTKIGDDLNPRSIGSSDTLAIPLAGAYGEKDTLKGLGDDDDKPFIVDTNPMGWDTIDEGRVEVDDYLHDPKSDIHASRTVAYRRGLLNVGAVAILIAGVLTLFAGYPIIAYYTKDRVGNKGAFGLGGTNATGQIGVIPSSMRSDLIDKDTPPEVYSRTGFDGSPYQLVFSDEFNNDGRSFYPGDDPFWEAVDLHYWGTNNYEWYDPSAITTRDGALQITLSETPDHNLNFRGGMLQSWNKFCFTGGYIEVSVRLPGSPSVPGLWPAVWTMGNLGRAGYGATLEGTWPYSYDSCDVGTLINQTDVNGIPLSSLTGGDVMFNQKHKSKALSFLSGQRMSACTCPEDYPELHPGPKLSDGTLRGRAAPEIDIFEAQVSKGILDVSQSCQWAPFNQLYTPANTTGPAYDLFGATSRHNTYTGELTQQSASVVSDASQTAVQYDGDGSFATYGFEYTTGPDGRVEWISDGQPQWRLNAAYNDPDPISQISRRVFPAEPMYIIMNLGISQNFATPNWNRLADLWPMIMSVDYVRVYQPVDAINVGCDPPDYPTSDFINRHYEAYTNPNLTIWGGTREQGGYQQNWPRNRLNPNACDAQLSTTPGSPTAPKPMAPLFNKNEIGLTTTDDN